MTRLFGAIYPPLTASRLRDWLISCTQESHANLGQSPASKKESKTNGGYGTTSSGSSLKSRQDISFLRRFLGLFEEEVLVSYYPTLPKHGTMQAGVVTQRQKSARLTNGSDCLSWPTMGVMDAEIDHPVEVWEARRKVKLKQGINLQFPLEVAVKAIDGQPAPASPSTTGKSRELLWYTPEAQNQEGYQVVNGKKYPRLGEQVNWKTPHGFSGQGSDGKYGGGGEFAKQVKNWGTPRQTTNGGACSPETTGKGARLEDQAGKQGQKLNPRWVESLMDIPFGWCNVDPDNYITSRVDELRLLGNGVVRTQATKAFRELIGP